MTELSLSIKCDLNTNLTNASQQSQQLWKRIYDVLSSYSLEGVRLAKCLYTSFTVSLFTLISKPNLEKISAAELHEAMSMQYLQEMFEKLSSLMITALRQDF